MLASKDRDVTTKWSGREGDGDLGGTARGTGGWGGGREGEGRETDLLTL